MYSGVTHLALSDEASVVTIKILIATLNVDSSRLKECGEEPLLSLQASSTLTV